MIGKAATSLQRSRNRELERPDQANGREHGRTRRTRGNRGPAWKPKEKNQTPVAAEEAQRRKMCGEVLTWGDGDVLQDRKCVGESAATWTWPGRLIFLDGVRCCCHPRRLAISTPKAMTIGRSEDEADMARHRG